MFIEVCDEVSRKLARRSTKSYIGLKMDVANGAEALSQLKVKNIVLVDDSRVDLSAGGYVHFSATDVQIVYHRNGLNITNWKPVRWLKTWWEARKNDCGCL